MGAKGFVIPEEGHIVNAMPPIDIDGNAEETDVISMKNFAHVDFIIQSGVSGGAVATFTVEACDDFVPTNTTAIAFALYSEETANGDTLGVRTAVASTGQAMSANNDIMYVISVDAAELPAGKPNIRVAFTNPGASQITSCVAILSGARYAGDANATAIA